MKRLLLAILALPTLVYANYQTYVLHTYGDPALANVVQNELNARSGGHATMYQDQLIIRATPTDYQAVLAIIQRIDTAPTPLTMNVMVGNHVQQTTTANQINAGIHRSVWINGHYQNSNHSSQGTSQYTARTSSGTPVSISQSTLVGLITPQIHHRQGQLWLSTGTTWINLSDGFYATPRLLPNGQISLQLHQSHHRAGTLHTQILDTTLTLSRGQWAKVGDLRTDNVQTTTHQGYAHTSTQQFTPIWIKID